MPVRQPAFAPGSRSVLLHTRPAARAVSSAGVPSKRTVPPAMTSTRRQSIATSSVWWVDSSTVRPSPARAISSRNRIRCSGSSPTVGSSSTRKPGSPTSAAASATRCRIPPDSFRIRRPRTSPSPTSSSTRRTSRCRARRSVSSFRIAT
ncbi:hypothetical protein SFUMM280S_05303 [Streptomyces fumanus]